MGARLTTTFPLPMATSLPVRALLTAMTTAWPSWQVWAWPGEGAANPPKNSAETVRKVAKWRRLICSSLPDCGASRGSVDEAPYHYPLTVRRSRVALGRQLPEGPDDAVGADGAVGQAGAGAVEPDSAE